MSASTNHDEELKKLVAIKDEVIRLTQKWQEYERDYILPMFRISEARGFDLQRAVLDNPGRNAGELFFEHFFPETKS